MYASTFDFQSEYEHNDLGTLYVSAVGGITPHFNATMYRSNGDPGDPEEGGECQYDELMVEDDNGIEYDFDNVIGDWDWLDELAIENACGDDDFDDEGYFD
jgi:hypothetical protein